jgi:hypothetical protein
MLISEVWFIRYLRGFTIEYLCMLFVGMALKVGLDALLDNMQNWNEYWRRQGKFRARVTKDEASR